MTSSEPKWKKEFRIQAQEATREKKLYRYLNEIRELDNSNPLVAQRTSVTNQLFSNLRHKSIVDSRARQNMGRSMTIEPIKPTKPEGQRKTIIGLSKLEPMNLDARVTLMQIRQKTILKNVHEQSGEDGTTEEEEAVFKRISTMLEKHLSSSDNPFKLLLADFQVYLITKYESCIIEYRAKEDHNIMAEGDEEIFNNTLDNLCREVQEFIKIIVKCLILFYNFDVCYFRVQSNGKATYLPCTILNFDNLLNFTTAIVFPQRVYRLVLDYFLFKHRKHNLKLLENANQYQHLITMSSLEISEKFQLRKDLFATQGSRGHHSQIIADFEMESDPIAENKPWEKGSRKMSDGDMSPSNGFKRERKRVHNPDPVSPSRDNYTNSVAGTIPEDIKDDPYADAIKALRYITEVDSPLEKMKVLLLVVKKILKAINDFYKNSSEKKEIVTGDQIMSLVVYVVLKSRCPNLFAYLDYIDVFMPPRMANTFTGYYLTVFNAASEYIAEYKPNQGGQDKSSRGSVKSLSRGSTDKKVDL
jgi:hypothetical protein